MAHERGQLALRRIDAEMRAELRELEPFAQAWHDRFGTTKVAAAELVALADELSLLRKLLRPAPAFARLMRMSKLLGHQIGNHAGWRFRVCMGRLGGGGPRTYWRLEEE